MGTREDVPAPTRKGDAERFRYLATAPAEINLWFADDAAERVSELTIEVPGDHVDVDVDRSLNIYSRAGRRELLRAVRVAVDKLRAAPAAPEGGDRG